MVANKIDLLAIIGPTASGKTALAVDIAKKYNGEIIAADSRTIYKGLDIGTAKPTAQEQQGVKHWGFDLINPDEQYSAAQFKAYADQAIADIKIRGKLPILVGGTGLYIDAVLYDYTFVEPNIKLREQYEAMPVTALQHVIAEQGLHLPENSTNKRHLLAVIERQGKAGTKKELSPGTIIIGLNPNKQVLRNRIAERARLMFGSGVVAEAEAAVGRYGWEAPGLTGGIYRVLHAYGANLDIEKARNEFAQSDMRLAKRQLTWFMRNTDITWFTDTTNAKHWLSAQAQGKLKQ